MADGQLFKPEKDYTKEADKQIPEAEELAKVLMALCLTEDFWLTQRATEQCSSIDREAIGAREASTAGKTPLFPISVYGADSLTGLRSCVDLKTACRHNHNI